MKFIPLEIIEKKKRGTEISNTEMQAFFSAFQSGSIPDYQMSAFLMAAWFRPLNSRETLQLTQLMRDSGAKLDFSSLQKPVVDKHSTGGIGDKTSLILNPLLAAAGLNIPMMAGRGLSFTGGTLDKLESIEGFNVHLSLDQFRHQVQQNGFALIGQTDEICPLDKRLYALRDVTGTVDSIPLICASILSKKLAEGAQALVMDVKYGSGAFMKSFEEAENLAFTLYRVGQEEGLPITAMVTSMEQPLGAFIGNAVEVQECIEIMQGGTKIADGFDLYADTRDLTIELGVEALLLTKQATQPEEARQQLLSLLQSGAVYEKFSELCRLQGAKSPQPKLGTRLSQEVLSPETGYLNWFNGEQIGMALIELGGGRLKSTDQINHQVGIELKKKLSHKVNVNEPIFKVFAEDEDGLARALARLQHGVSFEVSPKLKVPPALIAQTLRPGDPIGDTK